MEINIDGTYIFAHQHCITIKNIRKMT